MESPRLYSLDAFRGLTVAGMILVNNPGSWSDVYSPLLHAPWHGCTPTDLIFPFFLFIVGVSIHFSYQKRKEEGLTKATFQKIGKRSILIILLGLAMAWYTLPLGNMFSIERLSTLRIPGVLQRIGVVFFFTSILYLTTTWWSQIRWAASLLVFYYLLMCWVPIPDGSLPNLEPGTNMAAWFDRFLLNGHLWAQSKTWDPEGPLSTLPAIATGVLGLLAGQLFSALKSPSERAAWLFLVGGILILAGLAWSLVFPINKALWTSSYVLYTGGIAMQLWAALFWITDANGIKRWSMPFVYFGTNAIFAFVASGLLAKTMGRIQWGDTDHQISLWGFIYQHVYLVWLSPKNASLLFAISFVAVFLVISRWMHQRGIFLKV